MITLPAVLQKVMDSKDLNGLKPFAVLFRNKWVEEESTSESESESGYTGAGYAIDTLNPIDISHMIAKPNTLSMTLDVNEVAQYNANNVTLTLSDPENRFLEGAPGSYFPEGYQLYGSRVVLYYGLDNTNKTALFTGVIKDLPTHKPETYQVDLKLVSPLEMLKDIEAKDFSDKVTGEELHYEHQDDDSHRVYSTAGTGVGGFDAVYADGVKLFEGVDYEVSQTNMLGVSALITIVNDDYNNADITADYYTWKTNLTVEQIVTGLANLAGYNSGTEDIRNVVWNSAVKSQIVPTLNMTIGYKQNGLGYDYLGGNQYYWNGSSMGHGSSSFRYNLFPQNFRINFTFLTFYYGSSYYYRIGQFDNNGTIIAGFTLGFLWANNTLYLWVNKTYNGDTSRVGEILAVRGGQTPITITKSGSNITFATPYGTLNTTIEFDLNSNYYNEHIFSDTGYYPVLGNYSLTNTDDDVLLNGYGIVISGNRQNATWDMINATFSNENSQYNLEFRTSENGVSWSDFSTISIGSTIGETANYLQARLQITTLDYTTDLDNVYLYALSSSLVLSIVNLSGKTVLEALQDFALISGYEFGVNRDGVFFFRPRVQSPTPTYTLGGSEVVKVDTVKKNLSDFFTKLTLTFATVPLEFYANAGTRPTPIDRYGVINKEIDKPEIVNYDNPELAQAIGPQLLEIYSALPNVIQAAGKLNLALELGDIVNLKRNYPLTADKEASDYNKFERQDTYYRACKITGMNYNFAKRQITYTLRDVSNSNNSPLETAYLWEFVYDFPIRLGVK